MLGDLRVRSRDLEVDTSVLSPEEAAAAILGRLGDGLATVAVDRLTRIGL
jgi:hypothetical protein